jgi:hypothetical protein
MTGHDRVATHSRQATTTACPGYSRRVRSFDDAVRAAVAVVLDPLQPEHANGSAAVFGSRLGRAADLQLEAQPPEGASIARQKLATKSWQPISGARTLEILGPSPLDLRSQTYESNSAQKRETPVAIGVLKRAREDSNL